MQAFGKKRGGPVSYPARRSAISFFILFFSLFLLAGCFSKSTKLNPKSQVFSSKEEGFTLPLPEEWRLSEQKNTLFLAELQTGRVPPVRLTATDEKEIPRLEDYSKAASLQPLAQRMQKLSQGEISQFQTISSRRLELNGRVWEETVWSGARNGQPKIFHSYATSVGLNIIQLHFEFPVAFYNNPDQFITPILEGMVAHPRKRPRTDYVRAYRTIGEFYKSMKLWPEAIGAFKEAIAKKPKDAELHALLGESYFLNQQIDEALKELRQAAELSPQNARAQQGLAEVYFKSGSLNQAISALKRAINISPGNTALYTKLGNAYLEQGRTEEAVQTFQRLIKRNPKAAEAHLGLGKAYLKIDLYEQAGLELEQALRLQPKLVESHCLLEKVYSQLASSADAEKEKALCAAAEPKPS